LEEWVGCMSNFTYNLPFSNDKLLKGIIIMLKKENKYDLANLLRGANLQIENGGYSYYDGHCGRSDALATYITFFVNPDYLDVLDKVENKNLLARICDGLIPPDVGFDVKNVFFNMDLTKDFEVEDDLIADLENNVNAITYRIVGEVLPEDIRIKGYQMAEAYTYLYSVENSLRLFIEKIAKAKYGENYFSQLNIPRALQNTISSRQNNDAANKWMSVRGTELFYLDFKDLGAVINNNWDIFKDYFPSQDFILPKLNDMAECRNKIAHNSYVDDLERNLMKTYYNVILRQISDANVS
jgi:hypothetical protein